MANTIDNSLDIIDSRDVIERIDELEAKRDAITEAEQEIADASHCSAEELEAMECALADAEADFDEDERSELASLKALAEEASGYAADWQYGEALIRDTYFEDYAQELAEDIGAIDSNATWPNNCIDWERATRELQMDYSAVEFDGITYWTR